MSSTVATTATDSRLKSLTSGLVPSTAIALEWRDINFHLLVKNPKSTMLKTIYDNKHILSNISGSAKSGELLAIMGPTGCGKTSLLNVLAARAPMGAKQFASLDGKVFVNGEPRNDSAFRALSAYVLQDDKFFPHLTVYETLMIAAHFYLPSSYSQDQKEELLRTVIAVLGLEKAKHTIIGDEKVRGVSGGERRRASIAVQLITNPAVLFLDEPTSGLDSFQAQSVMEAMKQLALNNRLVISVIHQPRSSIFNMFDRLLLLSEGMIMYAGPSSGGVDFFAQAGYPCPESFSPSDYFLDVLSPDSSTPELEFASKNRIVDLNNLWFESQMEKSTVTFLAGASQLASVQPSFNGKRMLLNFRVLCWRAFAEQSRNRGPLILKIIVSSVFGLVIGGIYSGNHLDQRGIQNRNGIFFLIIINQTINAVLAVINVFPKEKVIVLRERAASAYDTSSYFLAKFCVEIPLNILPTLIFSIIIFWYCLLDI